MGCSRSRHARSRAWQRTAAPRPPHFASALEAVGSHAQDGSYELDARELRREGRLARRRSHPRRQRDGLRLGRHELHERGGVDVNQDRSASRDRWSASESEGSRGVPAGTSVNSASALVAAMASPSLTRRSMMDAFARIGTMRDGPPVLPDFEGLPRLDTLEDLGGLLVEFRNRDARHPFKSGRYQYSGQSPNG